MNSDVALNSYPDGFTLFRTGDAADEMYIIRKGKVRIYRVQDGETLTLGILHAGDFFGEMALFDDKPRSACAETIGDTELELMTKEQLEGRVLDPAIWRLLATLAERVREVDDEFDRRGLLPELANEKPGGSLGRAWTV